MNFVDCCEKNHLCLNSSKTKDMVIDFRRRPSPHFPMNIQGQDIEMQAEENRQKESQAAIKIQSWFRACRVRAYLRHLQKNAIIIQKTWRGFAARARVRQMVKEAYFTMKMNYYNEMEVRISKTWRGFYVRKHILDFYARKRYLEQILIKNELIRKELDEIEEAQKKEREHLKAVKEQTTKLYQAHKLHHLMGTSQIPGVFHSQPEMELLLRQLKYHPCTSQPHKDKTPGSVCESVRLSFSGSLQNKGTTPPEPGTSLPVIAKKTHKAKNKSACMSRK
ncbi:spermatogenesis-associated protein 17 [Cyprinodon tularosa]|uniref:spermatogenesis-associated protein 17 n=1 Tax=Cyprinodon tularosa TaxID=77115 RepID=UPI0018E288EF|nr:spermatogenesis-associated protein 17 [Cyprinodon tularosa]